MKPCVTGIVLATGGYMVAQNSLGSGQWQEITITALLAVTLYLGKRFGKKLSPIAIICISAVLGMVLYGI